mmetsp:Transcript_25680/g.64577  ORF Transcript_25680/g.64577 Transcript_25680/m.64577 type:complete len:236 (+) Transcript_25680:2710-3417(+)
MDFTVSGSSTWPSRNHAPTFAFGGPKTNASTSSLTSLASLFPSSASASSQRTRSPLLCRTGWIYWGCWRRYSIRFSRSLWSWVASGWSPPRGEGGRDAGGVMIDLCCFQERGRTKKMREGQCLCFCFCFCFCFQWGGVDFNSAPLKQRLYGRLFYVSFECFISRSDVCCACSTATKKEKDPLHLLFFSTKVLDKKKERTTTQRVFRLEVWFVSWGFLHWMHTDKGKEKDNFPLFQ